MASSALACVGPLLVTSLPTRAADWPSRPVVVVVPFAPGGAGNGSVRILAEVIGPKLGQPLVVENRPGAGGITGTATVTSSDSDHLLPMGSTSMTILPALRKDLPYDIGRDLQPIGLISRQPQVPAAGIERFSTELQAALRDPAVQQR